MRAWGHAESLYYSIIRAEGEVREQKYDTKGTHRHSKYVTYFLQVSHEIGNCLVHCQGWVN